MYTAHRLISGINIYGRVRRIGAGGGSSKKVLGEGDKVKPVSEQSNYFCVGSFLPFIPKRFTLLQLQNVILHCFYLFTVSIFLSFTHY